MKTIKIKYGNEISSNYTGIVEYEDQTKTWLKNGKLHREDGPAIIWYTGFKDWFLDGKCAWNSNRKKFDFTNIIILSKNPHPEYPTVQVWKYIDENWIQEQIVIPGMEGLIIE